MITYTIETLYHFSCEKCKKWWSIGDPFWASYKTMTCPHCGKESKLERNPDGKNASTWKPLDHVEVEKLLVGEADGE